MHVSLAVSLSISLCLLFVLSTMRFSTHSLHDSLFVYLSFPLSCHVFLSISHYMSLFPALFLSLCMSLVSICHCLFLPMSLSSLFSHYCLHLLPYVADICVLSHPFLIVHQHPLESPPMHFLIPFHSTLSTFSTEPPSFLTICQLSVQHPVCYGYNTTL